MKKHGYIVIIILFLSCCSLFKSKIPSYPTGIIFPIEKAKEISYKGKIIDNIQKKEGYLYFSTREGFIYCIDYENEKINWEFKASEQIESHPFLGKESIYVFDRKNHLYCINMEGEVRWENNINEGITSGVVELKDEVCLGTEKGNFIAFNTSDGKERWHFRAGGSIRSEPIGSNDVIMFGCDDKNIYFLSENGTLLGKFETGDKIRSALAVDGNCLYFGAENQYFYCVDIKKKKKKWKVKTGGKIIVPSVNDRKRVYVLSGNNVLYCLNKKNGTILWWNAIPSSSHFRLELIEDRITVSSLSSLLVCFDVKTGKKVGYFEAPTEIKSNPLWIAPHLLINLYNDRRNTGRLLFMKKGVNVILEPSKEYPRKINEEIVFSSSITGFFMPEYEFTIRYLHVPFGSDICHYMKEEGEKVIVQEKSDKNTWTWFPDKPGAYAIGVVVTDEKERAEIEIPFIIEEKENLRIEWWQHHIDLKQSSLFKNLKWRSAGPWKISGPITDIAVSKRNPYVIYASSAYGGVWKTVNNGTSWEPIFDNESCLSIGVIAVASSDIDTIWAGRLEAGMELTGEEPQDIIWAGSGENSTSRNSRAGTGVFKSVDGGNYWQNVGLNESHHISSIVINPDNPDIVYVAVMGHLFTRNEERGLYKTEDGGNTWNKILFINCDTGITDAVMNPDNPDILYAAAWEMKRKVWNFIESGEGSGIYKTTDGGETWKKLTKGFPEGKQVGRIGLDMAASDSSIIYAILDNLALRAEQDSSDLAKKVNMESSDLVQEKEKNVIGLEIYRTSDNGEIWEKINKDYIESFYDSCGYSFGNIRIDPKNENKVYILGIPLMVSKNGGETYESIGTIRLHRSHHALWIDSNNHNHLIEGNDGGLNFSYDGGNTWQEVNSIPVGQLQSIAYDMEEPYNIYGAVHDNGVYCGSHRGVQGISNAWKEILGGDVVCVQVDPEDSNIIYAEYPSGNVFRIERREGTYKDISPEAEFNESHLRFSRKAPILISPHNRFIIYLGANKLFKSYDMGEHWISISQDLTTNPEQGSITYGCIVTISESPVVPGLIYVGTDDGNVCVTKNGGVTWEKIIEGLPADKWVSWVEASNFDEGTAYVSLSGYYDDDFNKYLYKSVDYGKTWVSVVNNIPCGPICVIKEDPKNESVLYVGTDMGVYISIDGGASWSTLGSGLPAVYVTDIAIHPRDKDIIIATRGRGVYVMDVAMIQEFNMDVKEKKAHLFAIKPVYIDRNYPDIMPEAKIYYYLRESRTITFSIIDDLGEVIKKIEGTGDAGFNLVTWDLTVDGEGDKVQTANPGRYRIELKSDFLKLDGKLEIVNRFPNV